MSRPDSLLSNIDAAANAARSRYNQGRPVNTNGNESLGSQLSRGFSGLQDGINTLMRSSPSASSSREPAYSTTDLRAPAASTSQTPMQAEQIRTGPPQPGDVEELPGYTRRDPGNSLQSAGNIRGGNYATKEHRLSTRNNKLEIAVESVGKANFPVFIRGLADTIKGEVVIRLEKPEQINRIQVRLKVVVRCVVHRVHGGNHNRHPVIEEHLLLELSSSLYEVSPQETETPRLQGMHAYPYEFRLPDGLRFNGNELALPPSFALTASDPWQGSGFEVASVKYYLKCTLGRSGLFKPNDRIFAPVIFLQRHERPDIPFQRAAALEGLSGVAPVPGPTRDPQAWQGRTGMQEVKRGIFSGKRATLEATLLLPTPAIYGTRTPIPFCLRVLSTDPSVVANQNTVRVNLIQRTSLIAQGIDAVYETPVGSGTFSSDPDGGACKPGETRFRGVIAPSASRTPSFAAVGLQVGHAVVANIGDLQVVLPVQIQAWPPLKPPIIDVANSTGPVALEELLESPSAPELPPSYFEVIEAGERKGSR